MPEPFNVQEKLFEIISNLKEYDSPEKIEDLKTELKFLKEWDIESTITIVNFGEEIFDGINNTPGSVVSYIFCFPGCIGGSISGLNSNLRIIPVSTAFAGILFDPSEFYDQGYFIGAYLNGSKFRNANLAGADFTGANLSNAAFDNAVLTDSKIHNANFCGANLTGATMPDYANTISEFKTVVGNGNWNTNTIWINGSSLT